MDTEKPRSGDTVKELVYRGQVFYGFLTAGRVGTPTPRILQGSTVLLILRLLFLGSFSCSYKYSLGTEQATVGFHCTYELR